MGKEVDYSSMNIGEVLAETGGLKVNDIPALGRSGFAIADVQEPDFSRIEIRDPSGDLIGRYRDGQPIPEEIMARVSPMGAGGVADGGSDAFGEILMRRGWIVTRANGTGYQVSGPKGTRYVRDTTPAHVALRLNSAEEYRATQFTG
jgi:hypothetical protein